jgi:exopolysaccharide biosynthesis polyprenyl glycosylphosphotransferase
VFSRHHRKVKLLFAVTDIVWVVLAFEAAYQSRQWMPLEREFFLTIQAKATLLGLSILLWPVAALWLDIYDRLDAAHPRVILRDSFKQSAFCTVGLVLVQFVLRMDLSRVFLGMFGLLTWFALLAFRLNAGRLVRWVRSDFGGSHYVLVVGINERAQRVGRALEASESYGIRLVGFLEDSANSTIRLSREYPIQALACLPGLLERDVVDEIILCVDSRRMAAMEDLLILCDEYGVRTHVAADFFPHVNSQVYLDRLDQIPLLTFAAAPNDELLLFLKRLTDILLASAALILIAPLMLIVALLIKLTSPGPVIFRQMRCGLNGRRFTFYKFRSMVANAEQLKQDLMHLNQKEIAFKISNDPRQTAIGRYLRRFSIDEWPQLWNVLRGEMSLVGPRPAVPEEVQNYQPWQRRRLRMRPGLTCLWALEGRDHLDFDTWMRKDMEYIDNWSLSLDWKIMILTIPHVLAGKGAN